MVDLVDLGVLDGVGDRLGDHEPGRALDRRAGTAGRRRPVGSEAGAGWPGPPRLPAAHRRPVLRVAGRWPGRAAPERSTPRWAIARSTSSRRTRVGAVDPRGLQLKGDGQDPLLGAVVEVALHPSSFLQVRAGQAGCATRVICSTCRASSARSPRLSISAAASSATAATTAALGARRVELDPGGDRVPPYDVDHVAARRRGAAVGGDPAVLLGREEDPDRRGRRSRPPSTRRGRGWARRARSARSGPRRSGGG